jgi:signal transduction histidine kinase
MSIPEPIFRQPLRAPGSDFTKPDRHPAIAVDEILITHKLKHRRGRRPDSRQENIALLNLAKVMVHSPNELIDTLLRMAMQLCKAGTAGLSILESQENGEQVFRWTNLAGAFSNKIGGTTPRHFSPCGLTLDRDAPQLFKYPGNYFQYLNGIELQIVEALVLPIHLGAQKPGTIWVVSFDDKIKFDSEDVRIMAVLAEFTACALRLNGSSQAARTAHLNSVEEIATHKVTETALRLNQSALEMTLQARATQLQQLSVRLMHLQDDERRHLARELHDSAGQYLAAIQMNLSSLHKSPAVAGPEKAKVADTMDLAERCSTEIRTLSYLLHPPLLDELGLSSALSIYVEGFAKRSQISVHLEISEDIGRLPGEAEMVVFRVVQQSLANIHKHSGSSRADIALKLDGHVVVLKVCDHGHGIPTAMLEAISTSGLHAGVGLTGMRERVIDMGGSFSLDSSTKGTTINVRLPFKPLRVPA